VRRARATYAPLPNHPKPRQPQHHREKPEGAGKEQPLPKIHRRGMVGARRLVAHRHLFADRPRLAPADIALHRKALPAGVGKGDFGEIDRALAGIAVRPFGDIVGDLARRLRPALHHGDQMHQRAEADDGGGDGGNQRDRVGVHGASGLLRYLGRVPIVILGLDPRTQK